VEESETVQKEQKRNRIKVSTNKTGDEKEKIVKRRKG